MDGTKAASGEGMPEGAGGSGWKAETQIEYMEWDMADMCMHYEVPLQTAYEIDQTDVRGGEVSGSDQLDAGHSGVGGTDKLDASPPAESEGDTEADIMLNHRAIR